MLLLTPESARWRRVTVVAGLLLAVSYLAYSRRETPHGGSPIGLAYGGLALAMVLLLLFYGLRKRWHGRPIGSLESWCQSHLYLGLLVIVVVLCHSGFRFADRMAVAAFAALLAVAASGVVGALLYTVVPLLLTRVESNLTPEQLAQQLQQLEQAMARLAGGRSPQLRRLAGALLAEARPGRLAGWRLLLSPSSRRSAPRTARWEPLLQEVPPAEQHELQQLLVLSRQRQELSLALRQQLRYRNLLAAWLYLHVPLSVVLLLLTAVHLWGALRYS